MKVKLEGEVMVLVLDIGEEMIGALTKFAEENQIQAGSFSAIGALRDFELGYYYLDKKEYGRKKFPGIHELVACTGNVAIREGKPFLHVHAALGRQDYSLVGGHLFSGIVAVTVEIVLQRFSGRMERKFSDQTGLFLL